MKLKAATTCSILIVEDEPVTRACLVALLGHLGYHTVEAATVEEALANLDGPTRAIVDLNLGESLGTIVLERIRAENRPMKVAVSSATSDPALLAEVARHRPDVMLNKPIDVRALLEWLDDAG